jgi:hypothetical protein
MNQLVVVFELVIVSEGLVVNLQILLWILLGKSVEKRYEDEICLGIGIY